MGVTVDNIFSITCYYKRWKRLVACDWETLIYEHGNYLKCRHCSQSHVCDRELNKIVR